MTDNRAQEIKGTITLKDGTTSEFRIGVDYGWQQWGATQDRLGRSVPIVDALVAGLKDESLVISDSDEEDEGDDDEGEDEDPDTFLDSADGHWYVVRYGAKPQMHAPDCETCGGPTGYVCKQCNGPSPVGVGYATNRDGVHDPDACFCGYSQKSNPS